MAPRACHGRTRAVFGARGRLHLDAVPTCLRRVGSDRPLCVAAFPPPDPIEQKGGLHSFEKISERLKSGTIWRVSRRARVIAQAWAGHPDRATCVFSRGRERGGRGVVFCFVFSCSPGAFLIESALVGQSSSAPTKQRALSHESIGLNPRSSSARVCCDHNEHGGCPHRIMEAHSSRAFINHDLPHATWRTPPHQSSGRRVTHTGAPAVI